MSYISEIKRLCDSRNIGLTIVLIPDEMQVSKPLQTQVIAASGLAPASFDFTLPNRLLHARFRGAQDRLYRFDSLNSPPTRSTIGFTVQTTPIGTSRVMNWRRG